MSDLPPTPELDRMRAVRAQSEAIGAFLDHAGYTLCTYERVKGAGSEPQLWPTSKSIEQILADYFEIDLRKVDDERRAIMASLNGDEVKP